MVAIVFNGILLMAFAGGLLGGWMLLGLPVCFLLIILCLCLLPRNETTISTTEEPELLAEGNV